MAKPDKLPFDKMPRVAPDGDQSAARIRHLARIYRRAVYAYQHDMALHLGPSEVRLLVEDGAFAHLLDIAGEPTAAFGDSLDGCKRRR